MTFYLSSSFEEKLELEFIFKGFLLTNVVLFKDSRAPNVRG